MTEGDEGEDEIREARRRVEKEEARRGIRGGIKNGRGIEKRRG